MTTDQDNTRTLKTVLHYYQYDISKPGQAAAYQELCEVLKSNGLTCFDTISIDRPSTWYDMRIKPLNGQVIELETAYIFNNQWNTAPTSTDDQGLRVFDWAEAIYPNSKIKEGQYLDITDEMREIRENTYKCGYCGKNYYNPNALWCEDCISSEYLKEEDYRLLRLVSVSNDGKWKYKDTPPADLVEKIKDAQRIARLNRLEKDKRQDRINIEKKREAAETEYQAFKWLIEHDQDVKNVIYYNHTGRFCFGWREPLTEAEKSRLLDVLCEFPFDYDLK